MNNSHIINVTLEQSKAYVETAQALERLRHNPDFRKVIIEGYLEKESIRLVHLRADETQQTPEKQSALMLQIDAIGSLNNYFRAVDHLAMLAAKSIEDYNKMIAEGVDFEEDAH